MLKGFTLIELLVVVLIIGILAAVALPQYEKAVLKSRAMEPLPWLKRLAQEQEIYYLANGVYTSDVTELGFTLEELTFRDWVYDVREMRFQISYKQFRSLQWIHYFNDPAFYCQVPSGTAENSPYRALCKSFGSAKEVCLLEPAYDCYALR